MTNLSAFYPFTGINVAQADWERMALLFRGDGVVPDQNFPSFTNNKLAVVQHAAGANMSVDVSTGRCWVQGGFGELSTVSNQVIAAADPTNPRIDRVVISVVFGTPAIIVQVYTGTPAGSPTAPTLTRNGTQWDISLAQIAVAANATSIVTANITDERGNPRVCGYCADEYPAIICTAATHPTTCAPGGLIFETDTGLLFYNSGTWAAPSYASCTGATYAAPALTLTTTNAAGVATTGIRSDASVAVFDGTVPTTLAFGDAAATGAATVAARRDHKHGAPASPGTAKAVLLVSSYQSGTSTGTSYGAVGTVGTNTVEASCQVPVPFAGTLKNLYVQTNSTQNVGGSLVFTVRKNGADTAITVTVAAGAVAGQVSDTTHTVSVVAGDLLDVKFVNNAGPTSAGFLAVLEIDPT